MNNNPIKEYRKRNPKTKNVFDIDKERMDLIRSMKKDIVKKESEPSDQYEEAMKFQNDLSEKIKKYGTEIKERLYKYGEVLLPEDITYDLNDLIGIDKQKSEIEDLFIATKNILSVKEDFCKVGLHINMSSLLYGKPGTGKTSLILSMCKKHKLPLLLIYADKLVSSMLGDTLRNISSLFDDIRYYSKKIGCFVLFIDEIDAIASERNNPHEVGEMKRCVITLIQMLDTITRNNEPILIFGATNHEEMLDRAIWRRFGTHIKFDVPNWDIRKLIIKSHLDKVIKTNIIKTSPNLLQEIINSEIIKNITEGYTGSDLERALRRIVLKAIYKKYITIDDYIDSLKIVGRS